MRVRGIFVFILTIVICALIFLNGCKSESPALSSAKVITAYSIDSVAATINEADKTIAVTLPSGTDAGALVATFTTTGASVKIGTTIQVSGVTANNFITPQTYTVTAENGSTVNYIVTVTMEPPSGLAAYYPFNGNANDESRNGNNGIVNEATLTMDRFGNPNSAYYFNGSTSAIYSNVGTNLSLSTVTLTAWINIKGPGTWNPRIVSVSPIGSSFAYYSLEVAYSFLGLPDPVTTRPLAFQAACDPAPEQYDLYQSSLKLSDNSGWHHVAVTYDGSNIYFYFDGISDLQISANHDSLLFFSSAMLTIGFSDNGTDRFNGDIDEVRIYNRALSAGEILQIYNNY